MYTFVNWNETDKLLGVLGRRQFPLSTWQKSLKWTPHHDKIDTILAKRMVLLTKLLLKDGKKMLLFVKTAGGWWGKESLT